jgi:pectate lyase
MEIFDWSGAGIMVLDNTDHALDGRGRLLNTHEGAVHIKNNFIHHNRHGAGFGYGVNMGRGAYALIERNVFDENRHAITGDSSDGAKILLDTRLAKT